MVTEGDPGDRRRRPAPEAQTQARLRLIGHWLYGVSGGLWRGFNRWRRRHWRIRVLILLIIFSPLLAERLTHRVMIERLVKIACDAILLAGEPRLTHAFARYYRALEVEKLRALLMAGLDRDRDGALDADEARALQTIGLDPEQLRLEAFRVDLDHLAEALGRAGLLPASYDTAQVRRQIWAAAIEQTRLIAAPERRRIYATLDEFYSWPDYTEWETWAQGIDSFRWVVSSILFSLGPARTTVAWFAFCGLNALAVAVLCATRRRAVGMLVAAGLATAVTLLCSSGFQHATDWLYGVALVCLSAVVGSWGGRIAGAVKRPLPVVAATVLLAGCVVTAWGLSLILAPAPWYRWLHPPGGGFLFWLPETGLFMEVCIIPIGLLIAAAGATVLRLWATGRLGGDTVSPAAGGTEARR